MCLEKELFIGIDLGGTNLRVRIVNLFGDPKFVLGETLLLLDEIKTRTISDNNALFEIIYSSIQKRFGEKKPNIGCCIAGMTNGLVMKGSPNNRIKGDLDFPQRLHDLGYPTTLFNDMVAAWHGVKFFGPGKDLNSMIVGTFSTGVGISDGKAREFGHVPLNVDGQETCGCGKKARGHIESYVSGGAMIKRTKEFIINQGIKEHLILDFLLRDYNKANKTEFEAKDLRRNKILSEKVLSELNSKHIMKAYEKNPEQDPQKSEIKLTRKYLPYVIGATNSAYGPANALFCMGKLTKSKIWDILFVPAIKEYERSVDAKEGKYQPDFFDKIPRIERLNSEAQYGVIGAAYLHAKYLGYNLGNL